MKVCNASWEQRNIGMPAWEVELEAEDGCDSAAIVERLHDSAFAGSYVCVKMPVGDMRLVHALEDDGFRFVETQLGIAAELTSWQVPALLVRYVSCLRCETVQDDEQSWAEVIDRITDEMFVTDRMYLDPKMPCGTSACRYRNWMRDMMSDPEKTLLVWRKAKTDEFVGFDVMSSMAPTARAVLGGVFTRQTLMGLIHVCCFLRQLRAGGAQRYETSISSNNLPMLRCYAQLGAVVQGATYVFRKFA